MGSSELRDYVYRAYRPAAPCRGKHDSEVLLDWSAAGRPALLALKRRLQKGLGRGRVVFGVKERGGEPYWEFYFYNYERDPGLSPARVRAVLAPEWKMGAETGPTMDHVMFSFEVTEASLRTKDLSPLHFYTIFERGGETVSRSFGLRGGRFEPENVYLPCPLDTPRQKGIFKGLAARAARKAGPAADLFPADLMADCRSACFAFKPVEGRMPKAPNAVYLSTLRVGGLVGFLERFPYPEKLARRVKAERGKLDHLLYDVGYDFSMGGLLRFTKSGFYGIC